MRKKYHVTRSEVIERDKRGEILVTHSMTLESFDSFSEAEGFFNSVDLPISTIEVDVYKEIIQMDED
jgi:hypothetical protein